MSLQLFLTPSPPTRKKEIWTQQGVGKTLGVGRSRRYRLRKGKGRASVMLPVPEHIPSFCASYFSAKQSELYIKIQKHEPT